MSFRGGMPLYCVTRCDKGFKKCCHYCERWLCCSTNCTAWSKSRVNKCPNFFENIKKTNLRKDD